MITEDRGLGSKERAEGGAEIRESAFGAFSSPPSIGRVKMPGESHMANI